MFTTIFLESYKSSRCDRTYSLRCMSENHLDCISILTWAHWLIWLTCKATCLKGKYPVRTNLFSCVRSEWNCKPSHPFSAFCGRCCSTIKSSNKASKNKCFFRCDIIFSHTVSVFINCPHGPVIECASITNYESHPYNTITHLHSSNGLTVFHKSYKSSWSGLHEELKSYVNFKLLCG